MTDSIIFHYPLPIQTEGAVGSQVRPPLMLNAFRELGLSVEVVAGYGNQRAKSISIIKQQVSKGRKFRFVYSESSTGPSLITERHHFPLYPFLDFRFFSWLRLKSVPIGLFYRDIHWRFPFYRKQVEYWKMAIMIPLYWYDWFQYTRHVDVLFLPSLEMANFLPTKWPKNRIAALPPGCNISGDCFTEWEKKFHNRKKLRLFYVGSIDPTTTYDLSPLFESLCMSEDACLQLCCPEVQWKKYKAYYKMPDTNVVQVIHKSGFDIKSDYENADLFCIVRKPTSYLEFAMPIKLFEAIGYGLPIIANRGTLVAKFVEDEGVGWVIDGPDDLRSLCRYLNRNRQILIEKKRAVQEVRKNHTWLARARAVADIFSVY